MLDIEHLEIHVAHACNLRCDSCSHYSDQGHKGIVSLEDADRWMSAWRHRLSPGTFSLVGGEPTIHPRLTEFVRLARRHWPRAWLRIVTNGFFLHNHPELPQALEGDAKARIFLSVHHKSREYLDRVRPARDLLKQWSRTHGIRASYYCSFDRWRRTHLGSGSDMRPYDDGNPRRSWRNCNAKRCPQLFAAKIWKCAPLAYLGMQNARHKLSDEWAPYLAYQPLGPECSDEEMKAFFAKEDEPQCGMCPARPEKFSLPMPIVRAAANKPLERVSLG